MNRLEFSRDQINSSPLKFVFLALVKLFRNQADPKVCLVSQCCPDTKQLTLVVFLETLSANWASITPVTRSGVITFGR